MGDECIQKGLNHTKKLSQWCCFFHSCDYLELVWSFWKSIYPHSLSGFYQ